MTNSNKPRILVVDDNPDCRNLLQQMLEANDFQVQTAINGSDAIDKYKENPADLIIMDIVMPEKEGLETIIELNRLSLEGLSVYEETERQNYYRRTFYYLGDYNRAFYHAVLKRLFFIIGRSGIPLAPETEFVDSIFTGAFDSEFDYLYKKCSFTDSFEDFLHKIDETLGFKKDILDKYEIATTPEFRKLFK